MTGAQTYPGASTAHSYAAAYPGDSMKTNTIVWHSTEGTSLPTYSGGSIAPNLTAVPDFAKKRLVWYQHFGFDTSSRALENHAGGVQTNTLNVCQVEVVGTCDPATHKRWGSTPHLYMPDLPDWAIRDLAAFAAWAHDEHGVPLTSGVTWTSYPASYGNSPVRMSYAEWESYAGHCGHQHVPENDHGDPGAFPMAAILGVAKDPDTPPPPVAPPAPPKTTPTRYQVTINGLAYGYGAHGDQVTKVGTALVKKGFGKHYASGPGPDWSDADTLNYSDFQKSLGYTGTAAHQDADGVPGESTLKKLLGSLPSAKPTVHLANVVAAAKADPKAAQGHALHAADVKPVEAALKAEGLLSATYAGDGSFGSVTISAYAAWQRRCGYSGADANGLPGEATLTKLGAKHGFSVAA